MEIVKYKELGTDWQNDPDIACCQEDPGNTPSGCDCCYDNWVKELKSVKREFNRVNEQANQFNEQYKFTAAQRDKLKSWLDDLIKADQLARAVCDQFNIIGSQTEKICTNSGKAVKAIEILFCMVRDLFRQIDLTVTIYNQIWNCIKCLNSSEISETSGIGKCLKMYFEKLDGVIKTRIELIKAMMAAVKAAHVLHEEICSDYGLKQVISEWQGILNCDEKCGTTKPPPDPCKEEEKDPDGFASCKLTPILTLPICNDPYYQWVKTRYEFEVTEANDLATKLVEANKKKEALAACQSSLVAAIKEVNPKDLCK